MTDENEIEELLLKIKKESDTVYKNMLKRFPESVEVLRLIKEWDLEKSKQRFGFN